MSENKDYIEEIFDRLDLQQVRAFLLNGVQDSYIDTRSYTERINDRTNSIYDRLKALYIDEDEFNKASGDITEAITVTEQVYMEIGMKIGAQLLFQLLSK